MSNLRLGIWTPAPLSMRPDATTQPMLDALTRHGGGVDRNYLYAVDVLQRAEQLGFDITLIAQRFLGPDIDSWMFAAALAAVTRRIEIMAAVHPGIMDPRIIAKHAVSIDRISGGRFCVNIVNGRRPQEFAVYGEWLDHEAARYRRMQEFIKVLKGMWTSDDFNFDGEFYKMEHATVPTKSTRTPHVPVYAASRMDGGMAVIAEECDTWFVNYDKDHRKYDESLITIDREISLMRERAGRHGRTLKFGINACVLIGQTDDEANAQADAYLAHLARDPSIGSASGGLGANLIGSPDTVIERMNRYQAMGIDLFMLQFYPMREGLDVFASEVMPGLGTA